MQSITRLYFWSRLQIKLTGLVFTILAIFFAVGPAFAVKPPFALPSPSELNKIKSAVISTSKGKLSFELYPEEAPWHVANFKFLAEKGFYKGKAFHIFIKDFILQAGSNQEPRYTYFLPPEFSDLKHDRGILGMARAPDNLNPSRSSSGTQFHILLSRASKMDGEYTIFGRLVDGDKTLRSLEKYDKILNVEVFVSE